MSSMHRLLLLAVTSFTFACHHLFYLSLSLSNPLYRPNLIKNSLIIYFHFHFVMWRKRFFRSKKNKNANKQMNYKKLRISIYALANAIENKMFKECSLESRFVCYGCAHGT